jgi:hypothetical protein
MLTSNAENANYASTLVAEAPAVKHFERLQRQLARKFGDGRYGGPCRCGALWRVLEYAVEYGTLPRAVLQRIALHVEPPSPVARDKDKETARAEALNKAGVLSKATWSKWEGLDHARERRQIAQEKDQDQPPESRDRFTEMVQRLLETCRPHKSGKYKGTEIGYDPDNHNANCRLDGADDEDDEDPKEREKKVAKFIDELSDQLAHNREVRDPSFLPDLLLKSITPRQRDTLYQRFLDNGERWAAEAANQIALQQALAKDPELAKALDATVAELRLQWEKKTPTLTVRQRRLAAPWLYEKDYKYFAPTLTSGADGQPEFAFTPTPALRRLQLEQALLLGVVVRGNFDEERYWYERSTRFRAPRSDAEAMLWYQTFGSTPPGGLAQYAVNPGALIPSNSDLQVLVPAGALRATAANMSTYLLRVTGEIATNAAIAAAAETVAEKLGPAAGAAVPFVPTLVGLLRRRVVLSAALKRFARRFPAPRQVAGLPRQPNPHIKGKIPLDGTRTTGVQRASALEVKLVRLTGKGTMNWTPEEIALIKKTGKLPKGIIGHHINNAAEYPEWAGDPRNIQFVRGQSENLKKHGGAFQNRTQGPLIDRQAMINESGESK